MAEARFYIEEFFSLLFLFSMTMPFTNYYMVGKMLG